jgi:transposase-like protein
MDCPHCHSAQTTRLQRTTGLGYAVFRCQRCGGTFNERTGTPFNFIEVPTDIVFQVLFHRVRYQLSYRDVAEMFLLRGFDFTHETVRDWEARFAPIFADQLRAKRKGKAGHKWYVDETYVKVKGQWCYLYRAIDQEGNLVDSRLSQTRDMEAAKAFFKQTQDVAESPALVVTDGLRSYPRAIAEVLGPAVEHKPVSCTANRIEQDHRGIKRRYYPTLGFHDFDAAQRFCRVVDEVHHFFRPRRWMGEVVSLAERRAHFLQRVAELHNLFASA